MTIRRRAYGVCSPHLTFHSSSFTERGLNQFYFIKIIFHGTVFCSFYTSRDLFYLYLWCCKSTCSTRECVKEYPPRSTYICICARESERGNQVRKVQDLLMGWLCRGPPMRSQSDKSHTCCFLCCRPFLSRYFVPFPSSFSCLSFRTKRCPDKSSRTR
jgi:hypothetical protein